MKYGFFFNDLKKILAYRYGKEPAKRITKKAEAEYRRLEKEFPDVAGDGKFMAPFAAYYIALREHDAKNALPLLCKYGTHLGKKFRKMVYRATSVPGVSKLLWSNMPKLMDNMSGEKHGYTRRLVNEENKVIGVDILTCPLHDAAIRMGVPEAARIVCAMDKEYMAGFRHINYTRTKSVAEGGDCCDYRMTYGRK